MSISLSNIKYPDVNVVIRLPNDVEPQVLKPVTWLRFDSIGIGHLFQGLPLEFQKVHFFTHALLCILGTAVCLRESIPQPQNVQAQAVALSNSTPLSAWSLADSPVVTLVYELADASVDWRTTIIPTSELSSQTLSSSTSLISDDAEVIPPVPFSSEEAVAHSLSLGKWAQHSFSQAATTTRHSQNRAALIKRDDCCRASGLQGDIETAYQVKRRNPDFSMVHILVTRSPLYADVDESYIDSFFPDGVYDQRNGLLLLGTYHWHLHRNEVSFYPYPNLTSRGASEDGSALQESPSKLSIYTLPQDPKAAKLISRLSGTEPTAAFDAPLTKDQPHAMLWDWLFGSRIFGKFGTDMAKTLATSSPLVKAVESWRDKVRESKLASTVAAARARA